MKSKKTKEKYSNKKVVPGNGQTEKGKNNKVNSCTKRQTTNRAHKQKKLTAENLQNQETASCLVGYKKKDLSEVNYFIPKKNNERQDQNPTENGLLESSTEETCSNLASENSFWNRSSSNLASENSFWNRSTEDLKNGFKQIMIQKKNKQKLPTNQHEMGKSNSSEKLNNTESLQNKEYNQKNRRDSFSPQRTLSLEERSTYGNLRKTEEEHYRANKDSCNTHVLNNTELQTEVPKYSLDQFVLGKTSTKTGAIKKSSWMNLNQVTQPPTTVEAWLHANEKCLDQIMLKEKIKQMVETPPTKDKTDRKPTQTTEGINVTEALPKETVTHEHKEYKKRSECYRDKNPWSLKDLNIPSRRYSLDYPSQSDDASNLSEEWLGENQICLDQIIIEKIIKQKFRTKKYSETSTEKTFYKPKATKVTKMPLFLNSLLHAFQLYNISLSKTPYLLTKLDTTSSEYGHIRDIFFQSAHTYKIHCIKKVINPYLFLHYNLRKRSSFWAKEKLLFHGTQIENLDSICTENFDWRLVKRHKYGWGVSFSNSAYYASHYSDQSALTMVMFVAKVLVGMEWFGDCYTEVPEEPFDTTTNLDGRVYVKFDDYSFYPAYVIFYKNN